MKNDLGAPGLLVMTDVNGDKGHNEIFTDVVNRDNGGARREKAGGEFPARRKAKTSYSFLPAVMRGPGKGISESLRNS